MQQRISLITLCVGDLKKARAFYDALGWQVASEEQTDSIVAYNLNGMALALYPWAKMAEETGMALGPRPAAAPFTLAYNVNSEAEVDAMLAEAEAAGGKIIKPGQKVFWGGYSGYFTDPDGNFWEVAFNPFSPLGPNGEFQWGGVKQAGS